MGHENDFVRRFEVHHDFNRIDHDSSQDSTHGSSQKFAHHSLLELLRTKVWEEDATREADFVNEITTDVIRFAAPSIGAPDF